MFFIYKIDINQQHLFGSNEIISYICFNKTFNFKFMWKLKNNNEYAVIASTKKQAITKFKRDLGMDVKGYMLEKV